MERRREGERERGRAGTRSKTQEDGEGREQQRREITAWLISRCVCRLNNEIEQRVEMWKERKNCFENQQYPRRNAQAQQSRSSPLREREAKLYLIINLNMSLQFNLNMTHVFQTFQTAGLQSNQQYNRDQLFSALDQLSGQVYDRDVAQQLFEQCSTNTRGQITLEAFSQVIIEAEKILKRKIQQTEEQIHQYENEKHDCEQAARTEQVNQQLNNLGVDRDSQLSIAINSAQNIQSSAISDFASSFIAVAVDRNEQTTQPSTSLDKSNPQFNGKQLSFQISTGQEEVVVQLYVTDRNRQKLLLGRAHIDLGTLQDQQVHTLNLQLQNERGMILPTTLNLEAQWIHNKVRYHQDLIEKYEEGIRSLRQDVDDYKRDLLQIQQPFLERNQRSSLMQSLRPQQNASIGMTPAQNAFQYQQQQQNRQPQPQRIEPQPFQQFEARNQGLGENGEISDELYYGSVLYFGVMLLAVFQCFARPAYFDIILGMLFLIIIVRDCFEPTYIKLVGAINVVSIIMDFVWISFYKSMWNGTDKTLPSWGEAGDPVCRMTIVFCIFNLIVKSALCYFLYHYYQAAQKQTQVTFKFWQFEFVVGQHKQNLFSHQGLLI